MNIFTKITLLLMMGLCASWAVHAEAASIPGLYSTGVDSSNALLATGSVDSHYTLTAGADTRFTYPRSPVAVDLGSSPFNNWVANTASSQWIGLQRNIGGYTAGLYKYDITFDLTGLIPSTAVITGRWAADNGGTIFLNGVSTGITDPTPLGFQSFHPFTISSGFASGLNTLEFQVDNVLDPVEGFSETGLHVQFLSGTADPTGVPEPAGLLLLGFGLVGLAVIGKQNQIVN